MPRQNGGNTGMMGKGNLIGPSFWDRAEVSEALQAQDMGRLFSLLRQYCGLSQTDIGTLTEMSQGRVSKIIQGVRVEQFALIKRIADGLGMPDASRMELGLAPAAPIPLGHAAPALRPGDVPSSLAHSHEQAEDSVERRSFVRLAGSALAGAAAGASETGLRALADVFAGITVPREPAGPARAALEAQARRARADYQACRYGHLLGYLPELLGSLAAAAAAADGDGRQRLHVLSADAEQVAAGLALKLGDQALASLAADRAMRAAAASGDPVAVGAAARSVTHALMDSGHPAAAVDVAVAHAAKLEQATRLRTPEATATYGAALLRGAVAAARGEDRARARDLLGEAGRAAEGIRPENAGKTRGTAFSAANVRLHDMAVSVTLGDAGAALATARTINPDGITVTERRAAFFTDAARACWGRGWYDKAYLALRAADETAPEEVRRPEVRQLAQDIAAVAPPSVRRDARAFAAAVST